MGRGLALALVACTGCIKLAEFHGGDAGANDAPPDTPVQPGECVTGAPDQATAAMSGSALCAMGPGYAIRFAASGFKLPDELVVGSTDLLGAGPACNDEHQLGVSLYPLPPIAASSDLAVTSAAATILLPGPVVAKVGVTWSTTVPCVSKAMSGRSTFALFPDGRISRYDEITYPTLDSLTNCNCAGGTAPGYFVTDYMVFRGSDTPTLTGPAGGLINPSGSGGTDAGQLVCAIGSGWQLGYAYLSNSRARLLTPGSDVALVHDINTEGVGDPLDGATRNDTSTMIVDAQASCMQLLGTMMPYTMSLAPQLHITGGSTDTVIGTGRDGIYGGEDDTQMTGVPVDGANVTLAANGTDMIPAGWAVWIRGNAVHVGTITASNNPSGTWYRVQQGTDEAIIWFRDALMNGTTITIPTT